MTAAKRMGIPIFMANIIGFAIVFGVWKYNPEEPDNNNDSQQLDKS